MPTTTQEPEVFCPKCQGRMWDNRLTKRNDRAPDFKCRDRTCDGVVWPPRPGQRSPVSQPPANEKQPYSAGPYIPAIDGPIMQQETGAPPAGDRLEKQFALYDKCIAHAHGVAMRLFGNDVTDEAVARMAAVLFIQANQ